MNKVSTAELKAHMGRYLDMVREGETVYVTSHRKPIAALSPSQLDDALSIQAPTVPMEHLRRIKGIRPKSGAEGVDILLQDRQRR